MIEYRVTPGDRGVANQTVSGELGLYVVWIRCAVVILHVASAACAAGQLVVIVHMALGALEICMSVGEREPHRVVVEICGLPCAGAVAQLASLREVQRNVIRIGGFLVIREMATYARCRSALKSVSGVAGSAFQVRMHPRQCEPRVFQVVEPDAVPIVETMTLLACGRKTC